MYFQWHTYVLCEPYVIFYVCHNYYFSHLEIVFVRASILRSSPIHSNYQYLFIYLFFLHLRKCISKVWRNRKEDWSSGKRVKSQVHDKLSSPAKDIFGRRYENNCCKHIDILHLYSSVIL